MLIPQTIPDGTVISPPGTDNNQVTEEDPTGTDGTSGGDPHFVGFKGEQYDFMGEAGRWFAILHDAAVSVNCLMAAVSHHRFGTLQAKIAVSYAGRNILIERRTDSDGPIVKVNGERFLGEDDTVAVTGNTVTVRTTWYTIAVTRVLYDHGPDDLLSGVPHLDVRVWLTDDWNEDRATHGVLGQTAVDGRWITPSDGGLQGEGVIEGEWRDYIVSGPWASDFSYATATLSGI